MICSGASSDFKRLTKREVPTVQEIIAAFKNLCDKPVFLVPPHETHSALSGHIHPIRAVVQWNAVTAATTQVY